VIISKWFEEDNSKWMEKYTLGENVGSSCLWGASTGCKSCLQQPCLPVIQCESVQAQKRWRLFVVDLLLMGKGPSARVECARA
jgi:hypothetical protein